MLLIWVTLEIKRVVKLKAKATICKHTTLIYGLCPPKMQAKETETTIIYSVELFNGYKVSVTFDG